MAQEYKDLLFKDLCARLPYGVKILHNGWDFDRDCDYSTVETLIGIDDRFIHTLWRDEKDKHSIQEPLSILDFKPFLRPRSSMTEEEKKEEINLLKEIAKKQFDGIDEYYKYYDWLRSKHFNINLPDGLYIEVTESNNPYK